MRSIVIQDVFFYLGRLGTYRYRIADPDYKALELFKQLESRNHSLKDFNLILTSSNIYPEKQTQYLKKNNFLIIRELNVFWK